jgi:hypothetical protein
MKMFHICSFTKGLYRVQNNKQVFYFEDSDQFGPSKLDTRKDELSMVPDKHWFWRFYTPWRTAGRPVEAGKNLDTPAGIVQFAKWAE